MFITNLSPRIQLSHRSVVQESQTMYTFFFLKWEKTYSFSSTNRYVWTGTSLLNFPICFTRLVLFEKFLKRSWMLLFHLNKSHKITRRLARTFDRSLWITTLINGANYLSGSQQPVTNHLVQTIILLQLSLTVVNSLIQGLLFMLL